MGSGRGIRGKHVFFFFRLFSCASVFDKDDSNNDAKDGDGAEECVSGNLGDVNF